MPLSSLLIKKQKLKISSLFNVLSNIELSIELQNELIKILNSLYLGLDALYEDLSEFERLVIENQEQDEYEQKYKRAVEELIKQHREGKISTVEAMLLAPNR